MAKRWEVSFGSKGYQFRSEVEAGCRDEVVAKIFCIPGWLMFEVSPLETILYSADKVDCLKILEM